MATGGLEGFIANAKKMYGNSGIWLSQPPQPTVQEAEAAASSVKFDKDTIPDHLRQYPTERSPGLGWWPPKPDLRIPSSKLCTSCRAINFEAAFTTPRIDLGRDSQWQYVQERRAISEPDAKRISKCRFCEYLANAVDSPSETGDYTLVFHNEEQFCPDHDTALIKVLPFSGKDLDPGAIRGHSLSKTIICHCNRPVRKAGRSEIVSPVFDVSLAKLWLDTCRLEHSKCTMKEDAEMPETSLIDCCTRTLVSAGSHTDPRRSFVALSYVWGGPQSEPGQPKNTPDTKEPHARKEGLPSKLPLTIEDAITVTKKLGFQYLWVDQYCIDQRSPDDKSRQISQMDRIYSSADLTIIAAAGDNCHSGLPGVSAWRRDILDPFVLDDVFTFGIHPSEGYYPFEKGRWHTRGWTFQEGLFSRRRLVFTDTAMYYECKGHNKYDAGQSEMFGGAECPEYDFSKAYGKYDCLRSVVGPDTVSNVTKLRGNHIGDLIRCYRYIPEIPKNLRGFVDSLWTYTGLARNYSKRSLSNPGDALDAFRGVANALQNFKHPVFNTNGIPFVVSNDTEIADTCSLNSFLRGLEWRSDSYGQTPTPSLEPLKFPSWSWANVMVWKVTWDWDDDLIQVEEVLSDPIYSARDMEFEIKLGGNKKLHAFAEFAKVYQKLTPLEQSRMVPTALCFKSRVLVSTFASHGHTCGYKAIAETGQVYSDLGCGGFQIGVHVDVDPPRQQSNESGRAYQARSSPTICSPYAYDNAVYMAMASGKYGLVLLRFDDWDASVLLVEWGAGEKDGPRHQKTARRVGICLFRHSGAWQGDFSTFLECFSSEEIDLRLE